MKILSQIFPFIASMKGYNRNLFKGDLTAGLTVGVMLIPQGMAYALIAGLPAVYGLYASLIPLVVYSFLGTARKLSVGPVAMDSLFVATTLSAITTNTTSVEEYIQLALLLAFLMGIMQFIFGIFRLGFLVNFLSKPVIIGFTTAAALIIGLNQIKYLTGAKIPRNSKVHDLVYDSFQSLGSIHYLTLVIGAISILILLFLKRFVKGLPSALVLVFLGVLASYFFKFDSIGVSIVGEIPSGLPKFQVPVFSWIQVNQLLPGALALSLIAFMESISVAKAMEEKDDTIKIEPNKELIALGASNIIGSLFSSYAVAGGFSRSAVNEQAGAKTGVSGIISALVILFTLLFLTAIFAYLPDVVLASIILIAVYNLIDFKSPIALWQTDKKEFLMYLTTLLATGFIGITQGILLGVLISLVFLVYKISVPHMAQLGRIPNSNVYRNVERFPDAQISNDLLIVRFDARLFYANMDYFKRQLVKFEQGKALKAIIIDASGINSVDSSAINMIKKLNVAYKRRGIQLLFAGLKGPVRDTFVMHKIYLHHGYDNFFVSIKEAEDSLSGSLTKESKKITFQSNIT